MKFTFPAAFGVLFLAAATAAHAVPTGAPAPLLQSGVAVPYQIPPVLVVAGSSMTYDNSFASYANIFQIGAYANAANSSSAVVAAFGEANASVSGARSWGGNHAGIASAAGATAIADELDCDVMVSGGVCYGLVLATSGNYPSSNAIQVQTNNAPTNFANGLVLNASSYPALSTTGSVVKTIGAQTAAYGVNLSGWTFSSAEWTSPSFTVAATVASINSQVKVTGSATGNPTIAAVGAGGTPAANANLNVASLGTGSVQLVANGSVVLTAKSGGVTVLSGPVQLPAYTVAGLPTCNAGAAGEVAYVTDASAPTYNATLTGGSSTKTLAMCNGTNWMAH